MFFPAVVFEIGNKGLPTLRVGAMCREDAHSDSGLRPRGYDPRFRKNVFANEEDRPPMREVKNNFHAEGRQ